jgi:hypothetical protein
MGQEVLRLHRGESLEGIHQTLKVAAALGEKFLGSKSSRSLH